MKLDPSPRNQPNQCDNRIIETRLYTLTGWLQYTTLLTPVQRWFKSIISGQGRKMRYHEVHHVYTIVYTCMYNYTRIMISLI